MDLTIVKKHSSRNLVFSAMLWSCLGGLEIGRGIQQLLSQKWLYNWIVSFLIGAAFLGFGIFWAVLLLRRIDSTSTVHQ